MRSCFECLSTYYIPFALYLGNGQGLPHITVSSLSRWEREGGREGESQH